VWVFGARGAVFVGLKQARARLTYDSLLVGLRRNQGEGGGGTFEEVLALVLEDTGAGFEAWVALEEVHNSERFR
jgi:hypothetical protein